MHLEEAKKKERKKLKQYSICVKSIAEMCSFKSLKTRQHCGPLKHHPPLSSSSSSHNVRSYTALH